MQLEHDEARLRVCSKVADPHIEQVNEARTTGHDQHMKPGHLVTARQQVEVDNYDQGREAGHRRRPMICRLPSTLVKHLASTVLK